MTGVATATGLFEALSDAGARYVHWKSNEHLDAALEGHTDLDVLFDRAQCDLVRAVLARQGFKPFANTTHSGYPGIEDHLAVDPGTGRLVHCHAHFLLSAGRRHLKGHRIPWEERFLSTARTDPSSGVLVADPVLELLTLLTRAALKLRARDRLAALAGRRAIRGGMLAELEWLRERTEPEAVAALAKELLGPDARRTIEPLLHGTPRDAELRRFARAATPAFDEWKTRGRLAGAIAGWHREVLAIRAALNRRRLRRAAPSRRFIPGEGILVAFLGADGSGKSTAVEEVSAAFARKIDVLRLYMGSGDGPASLLRRPLRPLARAARRVRRTGQTGGAGSPTPGRDPAPILAGRVLWALTLAREKRNRLEKARQARTRGLVVLTDRYPQAQVLGFNDGPLLRPRAEAGGALLRRAADVEERVYLLAERQPPDLVIRLRISPEVAVVRKPDMTESEVARRDAAIGSMRWPETTRVVDIDASQPLDEVLRQATLAVWERI